MASPFPGMNPFLEQEDAWRDFHERFLPAVAAALAPQVSPAYIVKLEENIYLHERPADQRQLLGYADVAVSRTSSPPHAETSQGAVAAPARVLLPRVDVVRESFIEVRDREGRQLVTVIELLSPTNKKPSEDREQYLAKRAQLLRSEAHFVEIDLLRGWKRMPLMDEPHCDYCVLVSRIEDRPRADFWPIGLREPLPTAPVPLRAPQPDAQLDLQAILDRVYDEAYYRDYIYGGTPFPPLPDADATWARQFLPLSV